MAEAPTCLTGYCFYFKLHYCLELLPGGEVGEGRRKNGSMVRGKEGHTYIRDQWGMHGVERARGNRCVSLFCGSNWLGVWSVGQSGSEADEALDDTLKGGIAGGESLGEWTLNNCLSSPR